MGHTHWKGHRHIGRGNVQRTLEDTLAGDEPAPTLRVPPRSDCRFACTKMNRSFPARRLTRRVIVVQTALEGEAYGRLPPDAIPDLDAWVTPMDRDNHVITTLGVDDSKTLRSCSAQVSGGLNQRGFMPAGADGFGARDVPTYNDQGVVEVVDRRAHMPR